jgi:hypothetical protein
MRASTNPDFKKLRTEMVEKAIFARGVRSDLVLDAMRSVPREYDVLVLLGVVPISICPVRSSISSATPSQS